MNWIGVDYEISLVPKCIIIRVPPKMVQEVLALAEELLVKPMGPLKKLRSLAGKGSWVFSVAPRTRWTVQRLWAVVAATLAQGTVRSVSRRGGGKRTFLFAVRQVELPLKWIIAYRGSSAAPRKRVSGTPAVSALEMVSDACP